MADSKLSKGASKMGASSSTGASSSGYAAAGTSSASYMTAEEEAQLQVLLKKAKNTGRIAHQCLQARVSGLELVKEHQAISENGQIMTEPDNQFPWVPMRGVAMMKAASRPKAAPKPAPAIPQMEFIGAATGAMNDASKRRYPDDLESEMAFDEDEEAAWNEFEVIRAIEEYNAGGHATMTGPGPSNAGLGPVGLGQMDEVPDEAGTNAAATQAVLAAAGLPVGRPLVPTTKYAVQGEDHGPPSDEDSWFPPVDEEIQNPLVRLPENIGGANRWGQTVIKMPKLRNHRYSYEHVLRMALGGHTEMASYCGWILNKYGNTFMRFGGRTQAADFAGYLLRYRVRIISLQPDGFQRELA